MTSAATKAMLIAFGTILTVLILAISLWKLRRKVNFLELLYRSFNVLFYVMALIEIYAGTQDSAFSKALYSFFSGGITLVASIILTTILVKNRDYVLKKGRKK